MKIGIEIHQRLDGKKLFCNCSCAISEDAKHSISLSRRLHPVFSELGEVDRASQAEFAKDRLFEYQTFDANNCLVEMDEEPPHSLNPDALKLALEVSLQLHATPVDEVHIMRKLVIDGSNTSGFQRTSIVAVNGHIESSKGSIPIPQIAIEEESAGIVSAADGKAIYRLDRLGIPLIEISTTPDIKDGEHLVEVAEKIGMLLRATGKVARGLGTIRQDVNVSTEGGARVEIKGAQDLKMLPQLVQIEVQRQTELVKLLTELRASNALPVQKHFIDLTDSLRETKATLVANGIKSGSSVIAQKLPKHHGLLGRTLQPNKRYGTELSDYAKLAGVKGMIHSDEQLDKYGFTKAEEKSIRESLGMDSEDAFVMVIAPKTQAERALDFAVARANMNFVPEETRRANPDATSSFMRPLPGKARLYPETDLPPVRIDEHFLSSLSKRESLDEKRAKLEKVLNKEMANRILKSRNLHAFEKLVASGVDPTLAATTLEETLVSLRRDGVEFKDIESTLTELFAEYKKGAFVKAAIPEVLKGMAKGARPDAVITVFRLQKLTGEALEKIVEENGYDMGKIMQKYRLQVDAAEVAQIVKMKKNSDKPKNNDNDYV